MAAYNGGLNRLDKQAETFTHFTIHNSDLPDNGAQGLLCDEQGSIWVSTDHGLSRFDPDTETFKNYNTDDGLQGLTYNSWAYHKSLYTGQCHQLKRRRAKTTLLYRILRMRFHG